IAYQDVSGRPGHHLLPDLQTVRVNDVALLAIDVIQKSDVGGTIGIVFDRSDHRRNARLVALEIDQPVRLLGAATDEPRGNATCAVTAAGALLRLDQRLLGTILRDVVTRGDRL